MHPFSYRLRHRFREESGQTLLLFAFLLPVLFAFAAIAIDFGILRYQQEQLQSAADAAAVAGTLEVSYCGGYTDCPLMQQAVTQAMDENGYHDVTLIADQCSGAKHSSSSGITLTLNNPPCALGSSDPNHGDKNTIETIAAKQEPTYFGRILGIDHVTVSARAESSVGSSPFCIYASAVPAGQSAPSQDGAVTVQSGGHLTANCGLMDGSNSVNALVAGGSKGNSSNGGGAHITTTRTDVRGGANLQTGSQVSPDPNTQAPALPDPLSSVTPPANPYSTCQSLTGKIPSTLSAGCYSGLTVKHNLQLGPGLYYFTGPILLDQGSSVTGTDVTWYITGNGSLTMNDGSDLNLSAPAGTSDQTGTAASSNALYNIVYYQDPSDDKTITYDGGSRSGLQGIFYAPGAGLDVNDGGNSANYTILDVKTLTLNSGAILNMGSDYASQPDGESPIKGVTAVLSE